MILKFEKIEDNWYVVLPEYPGSKADLQMVEGADLLLEYLSNRKSFVYLYINIHTPINNESFTLYLIKENDEELSIGGAYYMSYDFDKQIWLCDVMKFVFDNTFPKVIHFNVSNEQEYIHYRLTNNKDFINLNKRNSRKLKT